MLKKHTKILEERAREQATICLLLSNAADASLVRQVLEEDYSIITGQQKLKEGGFDLLIADEDLFQSYKDTYKKLEEQSLPVMLPLLLLVDDDADILGDSEILEMVDDILTMPTSPKILMARIRLLLKTRSYSQQLQQEKKKYQLLAENSTDMISIHDREGTFTYVSPASKSILGYKPSELTGENFFDLINSKDRREIMMEHNSIFKKREPRKLEFRKKTKEGGYKWVESIIKLLETPENKSVIQASTRDISERKKYEQKLEKEIEFIDASLEFLPNIFFMVDEQLNFVRWNKNLVDNLGYSAKEIWRMSPYDFLDNKDHKKASRKIEEVFSNGEAELEANLITKDGEKIRHKINGRKYISGDKKYIIGTCVDISEQHRMMKSLQASNNEKKVLLQEIHHRVKNNLAVVSSMLELQAMESEDPELSEKLSDSQFRIQSIASVHEMLYQSKSFSQINMRKYLSQLTENIKATSQLDKDIRITKDIEPVKLNINQAIPCSLIANEVITNSFKHAFQAKGEGEISVTMTEEEGKVTLILKDNGSGLEENIDLDKPNSLGMKLINVLKQQLGAEMAIISQDGLSVRLHFQREDAKGSAGNIL